MINTDYKIRRESKLLIEHMSKLIINLTGKGVVVTKNTYNIGPKPFEYIKNTDEIESLLCAIIAFSSTSGSDKLDHLSLDAIKIKIDEIFKTFNLELRSDFNGV